MRRVERIGSAESLKFEPKPHKFSKIFKNHGDYPCAYHKAIEWLYENGFQHGMKDSGKYIAIVKGKYILPQKLYNFTKEELNAIDGVICLKSTNKGSVEIRLYDEFKEDDFTNFTTEYFLKRKGGIEDKDFYIDDKYWCESCGSHTHRCERQYGFCYECLADDWKPEPDKIDEIYQE